MDMIPLIWPWARRVSHTNSRMITAPYSRYGMMAAHELVLLVVSFRSLMCCVYSAELGGVVR